MNTKNVFKYIVHSVNGFADDADKFVEIDGKKFVDDGTGKAKVGEDGQPIPFVEKKGDEKPAIDYTQAELDELAKVNPHVAKLLSDQKKKEEEEQRLADERKKEAEENAKKNGEWQKLAEEREREITDLRTQVLNKDNLLGKYKGSVESVLKDIIATIPKENLVLIPEKFSPREKLEYITANAKLLGAKINSVKKNDGVDPNDQTPNATEEQTLVKEIDELQKKPNKTKSELDLMWEKSQKLKEIRKAKLEKK